MVSYESNNNNREDKDIANTTKTSKYSLLTQTITPHHNDLEKKQISRFSNPNSKRNGISFVDSYDEDNNSNSNKNVWKLNGISGKQTKKNEDIHSGILIILLLFTLLL